MYGCYWRYNNTLNWLLGTSMFFGMLSNILSPRQGYYSFNTPIFSYPQYPETYSSYTPVERFPSQRTQNYMYVGNTLQTVLETGISDSAYQPQGTLASIINSKPDNYDLVGNTLTSLTNTNSVNSQIQSETTPTPSQDISSSTSSNIRPAEIQTVAEVTEETEEIQNNTVEGSSYIARHGNKVTPSTAIVNRVKEIAQTINCDYKDLMGLIFCESSFKTVPDNWNGNSAVGLIQFTDININDLNNVYGTNLTKQKIARMSALEQLDWAEKSLLRAKQIAGFPSSHRLSASELYAINYAPANAKRKDYITRKGDGLYEGNEGLDLNKNGKITHSELAKKIEQGSLNVVC